MTEKERERAADQRWKKTGIETLDDKRLKIRSRTALNQIREQALSQEPAVTCRLM